MPTTQTTIALPDPYELPLVLAGHGWVSLPPHRHDGGAARLPGNSRDVSLPDGPGSSPQRRKAAVSPGTGTPRCGDDELLTPLRLGTQLALAAVTQRGRVLAVRLTTEHQLDGAGKAEAQRQLRHMLRIDCDLTAFWARCDGHPRLSWVARRGGGRLLRSPTLFEDLLKILFTTNCSWAATTGMAQRLVEAVGPVAPGGLRAFPDAAECDRGAAFFRDEVRAGYRARACAELAARFCSGELRDESFTDPELPTAVLRQRLLALRGFGPYAAGQALRLLGRYDDLALDSWCRSTLMRLLGRRRPPGDAAIARRYREFGDCAGLAMWCELTAAWHGEGAAVSRRRD